MTRKKSNVKALALAVTCAILAGGYSGLNPVYAAEPVFHEVKYDSVNQDLNYVNSSVTTVIPKITFGDVVLGGNIGGPSNITVGSYFSIYGRDGSINAAGNKFTVSGDGAITATSLKLGTEDVGTAIKNNADHITTNANDIQALETSKADAANVYTKAESDGKFAGKTYEDKVDALETTVGNNSSGLVKKVGDLEGKTTNITYDATNNTTTFTGKTVVQGANGTVTINNAEIEIKGINNDSITLDSGYVKASGYVEAPKFYIDNDNKFEKNSLSVAGVDSNGNQQYVRIGGGTISASGDVNVGGSLNTNTIGEATTGTGVTVDGVLLKDKGISAAGGKFTVDADGAVSAANGNFTVDSNGTKVKGNVTFNEGQNNQVKITDEGVVVGLGSTVIGSDGVYAGGHTEATANAVLGADGSIKGAGDGTGKYKFTVDGATGNVVSKGSVTANQAGFNDLAVTNGLTVGSATGDFVNMQNGNVVATGSVTAKGGLSAANGNFTVEGTTGNTTVKGTLNSKGNFSVGDADQFTVDAATGNVVSKGKITSEKAKIGAVEIANDGTITGVKAITTDTLTVSHGFITNGNIESKGLKVNGNAEITGTLGVNGAVTGASFNGATITATTFNGATIDATHFNNVTLSGGNVEANSIKGTTVTGTTVTDGAGASMNAGTVTGTKFTDGAATMTGGNLTGVNSITASGNITSTSGTIQGVTLTDGVATMKGGQVTAQNGLVVNTDNQLTSAGLKTDDISAKKGQIGNIQIDGATITSNTGTGLTIEGVNINNTALGNVTSIDGVAVGAVTGGNGLQFGGNAVVGATNKPFSSTGYEVDGEGNVTGKSFKVNGSNYLDSTGLTTEKAVIGGVNTLNDKGIDTSKNLHVGGQATFGDSTSGNYTTVNGGKVDITANGGTTTIEGAKITTKTLDVEDIILRNEMKDGSGTTINIKGSDGSMSVAGGKFAVDKDGQLTNKITGIASGHSYETKLETSTSGIKANYTNAINGNQNIIDMGASGISIGVAGTTPSVGAGFKAELDAATMGYGTANSIVVNENTIKSALGTDVTRVMTNSTTEQSIVDKVGAASRSLTANQIVDVAGGMTITTNSNGTTFSDGTTNTLIKGSSITSNKATGDTGVLDGSNLTLTNGANSTALTAGGATFTGDEGEKGGKVTTINGGTITTDTLNVERINLGEDILDSNGTPHGSNLSMDKQGNFRAKVGNTTLQTDIKGARMKFDNITPTGDVKSEVSVQTDTNGARMKFDNTTPTGGINSEVAVADGKAEMAVGANAAVTATDGEVKIKGGTQTVTTTNAGTVFENSAHNTPFVEADATYSGATNTTIYGNEITTGKITTDQLVIKGNGSGDTSSVDGGESGSIAFGGNGSITSNIKDGTKEVTFKTDKTGTFTEAKDGDNKTTNTVNAQGNTNVVTDGTNTSTVTQTATSIGGVITNGTVDLATAELNKDGFTVTQKDKTDVKIADGDVTVTNNRNTTDPQYANQTVHLSDLGSLNNLDGELKARDEYKNNETAVGAINAEAGIRREEVARLDNRIDDVNNRVDKVGAMAAAIASLKSIGYDPQAPSEFSIGLGQYKGETGVAMGFFHYPNKNFMINVSLSTAGGETMGGIGATWRFGHKSPQKLLEEQREAQARKELAAAEKYQAAAKLAKEAQERAEYAAKLARQAQVSADNAKAAADATQAKHFQ